MKCNESFVLGDHQYRYDRSAKVIKRNLRCVSFCDEVKHKLGIYHNHVLHDLVNVNLN